MTNADANNPLLSTPVATIAVDLFKSTMTSEQAGRFSADLIPKVITQCANLAEGIVSELQARGHLPGTLVEVEEPKADDATLILQALMLEIAEWKPYGPGDPRGEFCFDGQRHRGKLVKGVPMLERAAMDELADFVAPELKRL